MRVGRYQNMLRSILHTQVAANPNFAERARRNPRRFPESAAAAGTLSARARSLSPPWQPRAAVRCAKRTRRRRRARSLPNATAASLRPPYATPPPPCRRLRLDADVARSEPTDGRRLPWNVEKCSNRRPRRERRRGHCDPRSADKVIRASLVFVSSRARGAPRPTRRPSVPVAPYARMHATMISETTTSSSPHSEPTAPETRIRAHGKRK